MRNAFALISGLFLSLAAAIAPAHAQCTGQFPNNTVCGYTGGSAKGLPGPVTVPAGGLTPISGGTVLGNPTASTAVPQATNHPILGVPGSSTGQQGFAGATSGTVTVKAQDAAGSPVLLLPNVSGTIPSTVAAPLALDAASGQASITGGAGKVLAGSAPAFTATPILGVPGTLGGTLGIAGATSGTVVLAPQTAAGSPTLTLPTATGTFAVNATAPLVLNATTGGLTCPTCATSSGGGAITGTAPIAVSGAGVVSIPSLTGTGSTVALQTSPQFTTPDIGAATGASLNVSGALSGGSGSVTGAWGIGGLATATGGLTIGQGNVLRLLDGRGATFDGVISQTNTSPNTWINIDSNGGAGGWIGGVRIRTSTSGAGLTSTLEVTTGNVLVNGTFTSALAPSLHVKAAIPGLSLEDTTATGNHRNFSVTNGFNANGLFEVLYSSAAGGTPSLTALSLDGTTGIVNFPNGPTAPTAALGTSTTQLATTAFVQAAAGTAGTTVFYASRATAQAATISAGVQTVTLLGFYGLADGGQGATYTRTGAACTTVDKFASADGQCWQLELNTPAYPDYVGATVGNASHDAGAAIQALYTAGWRTVILHNGNYTATTSFAMPAYSRLTGESLSAALFKQFNGDQITGMSDSAVIDTLQLYGNGNIYTGRAVVCTAGGHQWIHDVIFAASSNHEVEVIGDGACTEMEIDRAIISSFNGATFYGIKLPDSEALTVGLRRFSNLTGAGGFLIDLGGSDQTWVSHSDGTSIKWNDGTNFAKVTDSRLAFAPVIKGQGNVTSRNTISTNVELTATAVNNIVSDNVIAGGITLDAGVTGVVVTPSNRYTTGGVVTDNSGNGSNITGNKTGPNLTIGTLPACGVATEGVRAFVTNGSGPTFYGTVSATGILGAPVFCNGSAWVYGMNDNGDSTRKAA